MPGLIVPILPKQTITLPHASVTTTTVIATGINVLQFLEGMIVIRLHSLSGATPGTNPADPNTLTLEAFAEVPSSEDPSQAFIGGSLAAVSLTHTAFPTAPADQKAYADAKAFSTPFPAFVRVEMTQYGITTTPSTVTISADLVLKY